MKHIEHKSLGLFERIKLSKRIFCSKIILKMNSIILFCSLKEDIEKVEKDLNEANEIKQFSQKFNEDKEQLREEILRIRELNLTYKDTLLSLHSAYIEDDYALMNCIFESIGLEKKQNKIGVNQNGRKSI